MAPCPESLCLLPRPRNLHLPGREIRCIVSVGMLTAGWGSVDGAGGWGKITLHTALPKFAERTVLARTMASV